MYPNPSHSAEHDRPDFIGRPLQLNGAFACAAHLVKDDATAYVAERVCEERMTFDVAVVYFGIARHHWLVKAGLRRLAGRLSVADMACLLDVFANQAFDPSCLEHMSDDFLDFFSPDELDAPTMALHDKLSGLDPIERCALAEFIERWHLGPSAEGAGLAAQAEAFGLSLTD